MPYFAIRIIDSKSYTLVYPILQLSKHFTLLFELYIEKIIDQFVKNQKYQVIFFKNIL